MTARCTVCGEYWSVSIYADIREYICPRCEKKERRENHESRKKIQKTSDPKNRRKQIPAS